METRETKRQAWIDHVAAWSASGKRLANPPCVEIVSGYLSDPGLLACRACSSA